MSRLLYQLSYATKTERKCTAMSRGMSTLVVKKTQWAKDDFKET